MEIRLGRPKHCSRDWDFCLGLALELAPFARRPHKRANGAYTPAFSKERGGALGLAEVAYGCVAGFGVAGAWLVGAVAAAGLTG